MFIYFSQLMDKPVIDKNGNPLGELYDIIVKFTEVYPVSSGMIIRKGFPNRKYAVIKWADIAEIDQKEVVLHLDSANLKFEEMHDNKEELTLRRDILDQQVVDTHNHKVIRVNDIHLLAVENAMVIAHVDISMRGIFRRLGLEKFVDFVVRLANKNASYLKSEHLISCKHIQPLNINPVSMTIKIDVPQKQLNNIPAADLGDIFLDLNIKQKAALFKSLDLATKAKIFINIDFKSQKRLIDELADKDAVEILKNIPSDEATDFLGKLPKEKVERFLNLMESLQSKKLSQLLGYSSDSAGGLMTKDFLNFTKDTKIDTVLKQIKEKGLQAEPIQFVYIVDENNHFIGATNFRRLILADPQEPIEKAAFPKTYFVHLDSGVKEVAYLMEKYKYNAIAVVDQHNVIQGVITVDDVLSQLISIAFRRLKKIKLPAKQ
jgi:magnesium transporter